MRVRHRLSKLLLRHGIVYDDGKAWTERHDRWLHHQRFDAAPTQSASRMPTRRWCWPPARRARLDEKIITLAAESELGPMTRRLACLRGISTLTGFALAVEIGDWERFSGGSIGAYLGLVPSEYSSGTSRVQGAITKTGNTHVRRLLVEAAWHHRSTYRPGVALRRRWDQAPAAARARAHAGNQRLHDRWVGLNLRRKRSVVANVAVARELAGWCWSLAILPPD